MADQKIPAPAPGAHAPAAAAQERARGEAQTHAHKDAHGEPREKLPRDAFTPEQLATPPAGAPLEGTKQVQAVLGPYAGMILSPPTAEADQAIADKWAVAMAYPPIDPNAPAPPELTEAERTAALEAANAYAEAQTPVTGDTKPAPKDRKPEGTHTADLHPARDDRAGYDTRGSSRR